jgi:hypothetical protein
LEEAELWVPRETKLFEGDRLQDVVTAYILYLEVRHPDHHKRFQQLLASNRAGAVAEAVVFSWLRSDSLEPVVSEDASKGGPDFMCRGRHGFFLVEATVLDANAVENRSGWPNELDDTARVFSMITPNLWRKTLHKAGQLADQEIPRLLAICLSHVGASALLGTLAARMLAAQSRKSAFYQVVDGKYQAERRSISGLLLIPVWEDECEVVGMLHPDPAKIFDYRDLSDVPFLRVKWPPTSEEVETEWIIGQPRPSRKLHTRVTLTNAELKGN